MTTKLPIWMQMMPIDVDLNSRDALVGGCLREIVTDRNLPDRGKKYKLLFLHEDKQNLEARRRRQRVGDP